MFQELIRAEAKGVYFFSRTPRNRFAYQRLTRNPSPSKSGPRSPSMFTGPGPTKP